MVAFYTWFLNKDEHELQLKIAYIKSLFYMMLIILLVCNFFWSNTFSMVKVILGDTILQYISLFLSVGLRFFTVLSAIALILFVISALLDNIPYKFMKSETYFYLGILIHGSFSRLKDSIENITIFLIAAYIFSYDVFIQYKSIYSESLWPMFLLITSAVFIMFSIPGIINRFFTLRSWINSLNKEEKLLPPKNGDTNLNGELLLLKTMNKNLEKEIIFLEAENNRLREKDVSLKEQGGTEKYI
ncbi:TPA: bZIP transcription factor [Clostridioides difficile]